MSLSTVNYTVSTSAVQISPPAVAASNSYSIVIQNTHATNIVYVGTSNAVTSSVYGLSLPSGGSVSIDDLTPIDQLWVISSGSATPVNTMAIVR